MRTDDKRKRLIMDRSHSFKKAVLSKIGRCLLLCVTALPTCAVVFILFFITKEALPFFENLKYTLEFFTSTEWAPSRAESPHFGALSIFYGTAMVTVLSCAIAVPLGVIASVALAEILPPNISQACKPVIELLAAIPSVAYGFFALIVLAPLMQNHGGAILSICLLSATLPIAAIASIPLSGMLSEKLKFNKRALYAICLGILSAPLLFAAFKVSGVEISSGTNALNASLILAIMALPTIVSISQDAITSVGKDMREGSLALGATRFEAIFKVVIPCAKSGIAVAVILGFMRVMGETMVVWMASGNSLKIPEPFYNFLEPVRTLTATIAGEMGEADQSTGSARYHVLFAMSFCLLVSGLVLNGASQFFGARKGAKQ